MGKWFRRTRIGRMTGVPSFPLTPVDPFGGEPRGPVFVAALQAGDWRTAEEMLAGVTTGDEREWFTNILDPVLGRPAGFDAWVETRPGSGAARLVRGAHGVVWAWAARGAGRASTVSRDGWALFHQRLRDADVDLFDAARLDAHDPSPWLHMLRTGRGLRIPKNELRGRYDEAESRCPRGWLHNYQYLQGICAKWGGSHELMFSFARDAAHAAPDGAPVIGLVAAAHFEAWLDLPEGDVKRSYFRRPEVADEIMLHAQRSVFSLDWVDHRGHQDQPEGRGRGDQTERDGHAVVVEDRAQDHAGDAADEDHQDEPTDRAGRQGDP